MKFNKMLLLLTIVLLITFLCTGCMWSLNPLNRIFGNYHNINQTLDVDYQSIDLIKITPYVKEIHLIPGNDNKLTIKLKGSINSTHTPEIIVGKSNNTLSILSQKKTLTNFSGLDNNLIMTISIPSEYNKDINVNSVSGDIYVSNLIFNNIKLSGVSANINVDDLDSKIVDLHSLSGKINVKNIKCVNFESSTISGEILADNIKTDNLSMKSVSGQIKHDGQSSKLSFNTTSGNVETNIDNANEDIDINTISGKVAINIQDNPNFRLDYKTLSGNFKSYDKLNIEKIQNKNVIASIGNGKVNIYVSTTSGDLVLNQIK